MHASSQLSCSRQTFERAASPGRLVPVTDLGQLMRGQRPEEAAALDRVRTLLPRRPPGPFWPGETPSPARAAEPPRA
jgi:hypothetical protein